MCGRYRPENPVVLRGGCSTGPHHSGVELHGFLSYLIKCNVEGAATTGSTGLVGAGQAGAGQHPRVRCCALHPRFLGKAALGAEVYNLGGGRDNSCSILEAFVRIENVSGRKSSYEYAIDQESRGRPHRVSISDLEQDAIALSVKLGYHQVAGRHLLRNL